MDISQAETNIALILQKLENDSGSIVKSISVNAIDVTQIESDRTQLQMEVQIDMERLPGHNWRT